MESTKLIILIAPNVSQLMGGEGIKALQTFEHFKKINPNVIQITHVRNKAHIERDLDLHDVNYVNDSLLSLFIWNSFILRYFIDLWFSSKAITLAEKIAAEKGFYGKDVIIHQTGPNSPVVPRSLSKLHLNTFGPINGNIHYPENFYDREPIKNKLRRWLHMPIQKLNKLFFNDLTKADLILVAGGNRTKQSLSTLGCQSAIMVDVDDCGVQNALLRRSRIQHAGANYRFVHFGRLVNYKGTDLMIKALAKTKMPIELDIVGDGDERQYCMSLVEKYGLQGRVTFKHWQRHADLLESLSEYRALALLSLAEANGIVVQEAMALGLPTISLNWGGPQLLIDHGENGYLVEVGNEEAIVVSVAAHLDRLSVDNDLAETLSINARKKAQSWNWNNVARNWLRYLDNLAQQSEQKTSNHSLNEQAIKRAT